MEEFKSSNERLGEKEEEEELKLMCLSGCVFMYCICKRLCTVMCVCVMWPLLNILTPLSHQQSSLSMAVIKASGWRSLGCLPYLPVS